jgi:hypothetical protein
MWQQMQKDCAIYRLARSYFWPAAHGLTGMRNIRST